MCQYLKLNLRISAIYEVVQGQISDGQCTRTASASATGQYTSAGPANATFALVSVESVKCMYQCGIENAAVVCQRLAPLERCQFSPDANGDPADYPTDFHNASTPPDSRLC